MFKLLFFVFLGFVKAESQQIQYEIVPPKTENGLVGRCCFSLNDNSGEQHRDKVIEQVLKSSNLINDKLMQQSYKPSDDIQIGGQQNQKHEYPPQNEPLVFYQEENSKVMEVKQLFQIVLSLPVNVYSDEKPLQSPKPPEIKEMCPEDNDSSDKNNTTSTTTVSSSRISSNGTTSTTPDSSSRISSNGTNDTHSSSTSNSSGTTSTTPDSSSRISSNGTNDTDSSSTSNSSGTTDKDVVLGNRNNINVPKTCTGSQIMTNKGECEHKFG